MISTHPKRPLTKAWGQIVEYCRRKITSDLIRDLRLTWDATTRSDAPCPFDAATVIVYAYIAVMTNEAAKAKLLAEYCDDGPGRGIVIGGLLQMLLDSAAVNDVLSINAKMVRDGESGGCLLS